MQSAEQRKERRGRYIDVRTGVGHLGDLVEMHILGEAYEMSAGLATQVLNGRTDNPIEEIYPR